MTIITFVFFVGMSYAATEDWERFTLVGDISDSIADIHFIDGRHGLIAKNRNVYYTSDSGKTWTQSQKVNGAFVARSPIKSICLSDVNTGWIVVEDDDNIYKSVARFKASGNGSFSLAKIPSGRYVVEAKTAGAKTTTAIMIQRF